MPIPSGPTAAGLVSPERLGRWRREAGAEAAALGAAARSACALASSSEAQVRPCWCTPCHRASLNKLYDSSGSGSDVVSGRPELGLQPWWPC